FLKIGGMDEPTARDAISGGIKSPRLLIAELQGVDGRYDRVFPEEISLDKEIADHFEQDADRPEAQKLVEATLLRLLVMWRRARSPGVDLDDAGRTFTAAAYDAAPTRYWERRIDAGSGLTIELTGSDIEDIVRLADAEAGNQGHDGLAGVVFVVLNRVA